ncbi:MAG: methyltransferase domain-containing protein [Gammaproteobacteria bacterium]|nr:methyltransferase domain-containing protein [Gammaproteobacteria bacterium]
MNPQDFTDHPTAPDIESSTEAYAARFGGDIGRWFLDVQNAGTATLLTRAGLQSTGLKVLDVGGGHAQNIPLMRKMAHHLTILGSDDSCQNLFRDAVSSGAVNYNIGPLTALPYADNEFDVVLCYRIMAHIEDWPLLIRELSRVARSLVIVDYTSRFSVNALAELFFGMKKSIEKNTRFYRLHRSSEVVQEFSKSAMRPVAHYSQYFFPMAIHRAVKSRVFSVVLEKVPRIFGLTHIFGSPVLHAFRPDTTDENV